MNFSNEKLKPIFEELKNDLPHIFVSPENVNIIQEPNEFYQKLIKGIETSEERIILSSLYLGNSELEIKLVEQLHKKLSKNSKIQVLVLLDYLRGTRGKMSSFQVLKSLKTEFPHQVEINFFLTPNYNSWKKLLPSRLNEVIGVQHIKAYIFDNDTLISGANLSDWYFVNRQDRYVLFQNEKTLTDFYEKLIKKISLTSYSINNNGIMSNPIVKQEKIIEEIKNLFSNENYLSKLNQNMTDTVVFPTFQFGPWNIRYDEKITEILLSLNEFNASLSSAYFNLPLNYQNILLNSRMKNISIITASPKANGFYTAKDISKNIPKMYSILEQEFFNKIKNNIKIFEYKNDLNWTFHAKGLWLDFNDKTIISLIGSPNFGNRSKNLDVESQIVLMTENDTLQKKLKNERDNLFLHTKPVSRYTFETIKRKPGVLLKMVSKFFTKFL
eukprot:gene1054-10573_t